MGTGTLSEGKKWVGHEATNSLPSEYLEVIYIMLYVLMAHSVPLRLLSFRDFFFFGRSFRIAAFDTYHGASVIMRRVFDWKRSSISMLDVDAVPQSSIP
jgi:hypothetical protein